MSETNEKCMMERVLRWLPKVWLKRVRAVEVLRVETGSRKSRQAKC
jgi:hypothetical protein